MIDTSVKLKILRNKFVSTIQLGQLVLLEPPFQVMKRLVLLKHVLWSCFKRILNNVLVC